MENRNFKHAYLGTMILCLQTYLKKCGSIALPSTDFWTQTEFEIDNLVFKDNKMLTCNIWHILKHGSQTRGPFSIKSQQFSKHFLVDGFSPI